MDYVSFKSIFGFLMSVEFVVAMIAHEAVYYPWLYCTCIILNFMCIGGMYAIFPVAVINVFGLKHGPTILTIIYFGSLLASIINVINTMYLLDIIGFENLFYVGALA